MSGYDFASSGKAREMIAVVVVAVLLATSASVMVPNNASAADQNPYIDLTITVTILRVRAIDDMDPDWPWNPHNPADFSCTVVVGAEAQGSTRINDDDDISPTDWSWTFNVDDNTAIHLVEIYLFEWDGETTYEEADISAGSSTKYAYINYDLTTASWQGASTEWGTVDYVGDSNGYGHVSGDEDGPSTNNRDAEIWFWISQNDNDGDGLTYQQEVNGFSIGNAFYQTNPQTYDGTDFDGDGLGGSSEYSARTSPILRDTDGDKIWDGYEVSWSTLSPRVSTDGFWFFQNLRDAYATIPAALFITAVWMNHGVLYNLLLNTVLNMAKGFLNPEPSASTILSDFIDAAVLVGLMSPAAGALFSATLAMLKWFEATIIYDLALTYVHKYNAFDYDWNFPYETATFGYIEQTHVGKYHLDNVDSTCYPSTTLASPYWSDGAVHPSSSSLYGYVSTMVNMLKYLSGESASFADQNADGVKDFQDVLLYANNNIYPVLTEPGGTAGESHTFMRFKLVDGTLTHPKESISGTGYKLEHGILEWCVGVDRSFSYDNSANPYWAWNSKFIGEEVFGEPSSVRVWEAAADLCGILYYGFNTVKTLRQTIQAMLSGTSDLTPPTGSISINSGATYTNSQTVTLTLSAGSGTSEMRLKKDGWAWGDWQKYSSPVSGYTLNNQDGTRTVYVQFKDAAGNIGPEASDTIVLDRAAPTGVSVSINGGATTTTNVLVTLTIAASDSVSGLGQMQFSNDGSSWSSWETFGTSKAWTLSSGDGTKTVYMKVRDNAGNVAGQVSDTITLDTTVPTASIVIENGLDYVRWTQVFLSISASDTGSGPSQMRLSNDGVWDTEQWVTYATSYVWTLTSGDGLKTVYLQVKDNAGFISPTAYDSVGLDTVNPTGSVAINGGAASTSSPDVTLTIIAGDSYSGIGGMRVSNDGVFDTEPLETYVYSKPWTLSEGDGAKTVYVNIQDKAGNWITVTDTITLDTSPPIVKLIISNDQEYTSTTSVALEISAVDPGGGALNEMRFSNDGDVWSQWESYAVTKTWQLSTGDGIKTVYVEVSDFAGFIGSNSDTIILNTGPPTAPLNLVATLNANGDVILTWDPPASSGGSSIFSYRVDKGVTSGGTVLLKYSPSRTTTDTATASGSLYFYTVMAVNAQGRSEPSNEASVRIPADVTAYSETFDDGDISDWSRVDEPPDQSAIEVVTPPGSTSPAMHIWYTSQSVGRATTPPIACDFTAPYKISLKVYFPDPPLVINRKVIVVDDGRVLVVVSYGVYYSNAVLSNEIGTVTYNSWENIEIWADPVSQTYTFILNGVQTPSVPFTTTGIPGQTLSFGSEVNGGKRSYGEAYWDDVAVYGSEPLTAPFIYAPSVSTSMIKLQWSIPSANAGKQVTSYKIYRGTSPGGETYLAAVDGLHFDENRICFYYEDTAVTYGVKYYYQISSVTSAGEGPLSYEFQATPCTAPSAPLNLVATGGNQEVALAWSPPSSDGGSPITWYNVVRSTTSGSGFVIISYVPAPQTTYTDNAVTNGVTYYYKVYARNYHFSGPTTNEVSATPAAQVPGAPQDLAAASSVSTVTLTWSPPAFDGGSPVTLYKIYRGESPGSEVYLAESTTTNYVDNNVVNGWTYYYRVSAVNAVGEGPMSNEVSTMPGGPPGPPRNLMATPGNAQVTLSWSAPLEFFGSAPITYKIYRGTTSGGETYLTSVPGSQHTYLDLAVVNGVTYYYKVTAVNSFGEGPASNEASATPATVPSACTNLVAVAEGNIILLTWTAPSSDGGSPLIGYNIYRGTSSGGETFLRQIKPVSPEWQDSVVTPGVTYYYKVTAVNNVGEGPYSNEASATPGAITVPGAPQGLTATSTATGILLAWSPPVSDGGSPITSYKIFRGTKSGQLTLLSTVGGDILSYLDTAVTMNKKYYYQVSAVNSVGEGARSAEVMCQYTGAPPTVPTAPQNLQASPGNGQITLTWSAPSSNGGSPITNYKIYRGLTSGGETYLTQVSGSTLTYTNTGLTNGVMYYYKVTAVNSIGEGPPSNEASAAPTSATVPGAPTGLVVTPTGTGLHLVWNPPASDGGSPITSYKIYRSTKAGAETYYATVPGSQTYFDDNSVSKNRRYYYKVSAVNVVGEGPLSSENSGVWPGPLAVFVIDSTEPISESTATAPAYESCRATGLLGPRQASLTMQDTQSAFG